MPILILHPTSVAQWHALLGEAQKTCAIRLKEEIESYLIFLLMRFTDDPAVASSAIGLEFLHSYQALRHSHQHQALKEVGDKCLLLAGLFPDRAAKKRVGISYYVKLGQTAYALVAQHLTTHEALFNNLRLQFPLLMDVLQAMRPTPALTNNLLQAFELWQETGSQMAWQQLCKATKSLPQLPPKNKSFH